MLIAQRSGLVGNGRGAKTRCAVLAVGLLLATLISNEASANRPRPGFQVLDVIVDEPILNEVCSNLALDANRRAAVRESFRTYFQALQQLDATTYENMLNAGYRRVQELQAEVLERSKAAMNNEGRERAREVLDAGLREVDILFGEVKADIFAAQILGFHQSDALLAQWLAEIQKVASLDDVQIAAVARLVRRLNVFSFQPEELESVPDFSRPLDLSQLVSEASVKGGELYAISAAAQTPPDAAKPDRRADLPNARDELTRIISDWELRLDQRLTEVISERRDVLRNSGDFNSKEASARRVQSWIRGWAVFAPASEQIIDLLVRLDDLSARDAWQDRVDRAMCPKLTEERLPARMVDWLKSRPDTALEQLVAAQEIQRDYLSQLRPLIRAAVDHGIALHCRSDSSEGESSLHVQFAKDLRALYDLGVQSLRRLYTVLNDQQRQTLHTTLSRSHKLIGPYCDVGFFEALAEIEGHSKH